MFDFIAAHRKAILAAIGTVLILVVDSATADHIVAIADTILILLVPNSQEAIERVYPHRRRR